MNYLAIFSPTGGVKAVADCLMGNGWEVLDLTRRDADFTEITFTNEDVLLAAVPSYGGRVPELASRRLARLRGSGACAESCPVGAIDPACPRETDGAVCISCMRCVAVCPKHARQVDAEKLAALTEKLQAVCAGRKPNELFL